MKKQRQTKALFFMLVTFLTCFLLSACGFHLAGREQIPVQLKQLYVTSHDPYSDFSKQIKQALRLHHITLVSNPTQARFTLLLSNTALSTSQTSIGSNQQTRQYNAVFTSHFILKDNKTQATISDFTLSQQQAVTLFSNKLIENTPQLEQTQQTLQRDVISQLFFHLDAENTRAALNKATHKKAP
jgi:outer membrane lipopolysaccharide assembly protein LptE/RlpB